MKNPCIPFTLGEEGYYKYRLKVTEYLPNLVILDGFETSMNDTFKVENIEKEEEVKEKEKP